MPSERFETYVLAIKALESEEILNQITASCFPDTDKKSRDKTLKALNKNRDIVIKPVSNDKPLNSEDAFAMLQAKMQGKA